MIEAQPSSPALSESRPISLFPLEEHSAIIVPSTAMGCRGGATWIVRIFRSMKFSAYSKSLG